MSRDETAYAVIVGSGVAGSLVAQSLLDAGMGPILMLEAGPDVPMADPAWWFKYVANGAAPYQATYDETTDFTSTGVQLWNIVGGRVQGRGGTTNHWGGWTPRFMPEDFCLETNTSTGIDWPFSYGDLEPYYCQAEAFFGVEGDSANQSPVRSKPYPFPAAAYPITAGPFIKAFTNQGITYEHLPMARYGTEWNGNGPCRTTGTCDYCPVGGRFTGNQPLDAIQSEQFELRLGAPVVTLRMASKTNAAGVTYLDLATQQTVNVDADLVVLAAGAFETPKLLQRSTSSYWPSGVGNDTGLVGRFLVANQFFETSGSTPTNPQQFEQELGFPNLCSRFYDSPEMQAFGKLFMTMDFALPTVDIASLMAKGLDAPAIRAATTGPAFWQLYGNLAPIGQFNNQVTNGSGTTRYGLPKTVFSTPDPVYSPEAMTYYTNLCTGLLKDMGCQKVISANYKQRGDHAACTTRMSSDPTVGVVDTDLKVHGTDNVYVVGNSILPTLPAANPSLTMVALIYKSLSESSDLLTRT